MAGYDTGLLVHWGQRLGDVARMKWEQIDFENGIVSTIAAKKRNRRTCTVNLLYVYFDVIC